MQLNPDFIDEVNKWCVSLSAEIEKSIAVGKKVYIIALSRKMPRFFEWLRKEQPSEESKKLVSNLDIKNVELTTEYAIPIIFYESCEKKNEEENVDGIIVDDAIIFGGTANRVCREWMVASGKKPMYASLFRSDSGSLVKDYVEKDVYSTEGRSFEELKKSLREISKCIYSSSLPVDIEFPIVRVSLPYFEIKEFIKNNAASTWRQYEIKSDMMPESLESYTLLLDSERLGDSGNDIAKIRIFNKGDKSVLEIIAPHSIALDSLEKKDFLGDTYKRVLELVIDRVGISENMESQQRYESEDLLPASLYVRKKSLMIVWVNYLLSLSTFIRNKKYVLPDNIEMHIDVSDVALILGNELANELVGPLNELLQGNDYVTLNEPSVALPIYINPPTLKGIYARNVVMSMSPEAGVDKNLDEIYGVSYFSGPLYNHVPFRNLIGHHLIGETYDSLRVHLNIFHYNDPLLEEKINKWIDKRIDESCISPKYEMIRGSDGREYFRRFFLCGSNSIELS